VTAVKGITTMKCSLEGKTAIVTGASRGIGLEMARRFSAAGADVVICSRNQKAVDEAAADITADGGKVLPLAINVADERDRVRLVDQAMEWAGRIDILVNNAGANPTFGGLATLTEKALDTVIDVNLKATLFIAQRVFHAWMKDNGGVILNISSIGGKQCMPGISGYCTVKAALNHLGRCMAAEWGKYGVRVNTILPGIIKTKFSKALWENPKLQHEMASYPISRFGEVEDIVGAALLLVSEASAYTTGAEFVIDGGSLIGG